MATTEKIIEKGTPYAFRYTVSGLVEPETSLLAQARCHIEGDSVEFNLYRDPEEDSDQFRERGDRWIGRELSRVNVLTGKLLRATCREVEPPLDKYTVKVCPSWKHKVQMPSTHRGWSDKAVEFRVGAWEIASHTQDPVLRFVMLDAICESKSVNQDWPNDSHLPPRFAEVRLIRNLLVHGCETPNPQVRRYLELFSSTVPISRFSGRFDHIQLARFRSGHLLRAVWSIVLNDCDDIERDLGTVKPAGFSGFLLLDDALKLAENDQS